MPSKSKPKVKICCISSIQEAQIAIECGASVLGLVGPMPSGPGIIDDKLIASIAKTIPTDIETFLLTSETNAEKIIAHHNLVNTTSIQLVDELPLRDYEQIRQQLPTIKLIQVIHVIDENSVTQAIEISEYVDVILLDSGNPNLAVKELGGTGRTHNWNLSKKIRDGIKIPLFLAGGLNQQNVKQAIDFVQPYGIDLCSSVRTNDKLDRQKLINFFKAID